MQAACFVILFTFAGEEEQMVRDEPHSFCPRKSAASACLLHVSLSSHPASLPTKLSGPWNKYTNDNFKKDELLNYLIFRATLQNIEFSRHLLPWRNYLFPQINQSSIETYLPFFCSLGENSDIWPFPHLLCSPSSQR